MNGLFCNQFVIISLVICSLASCKVGPNFHPPDPPKVSRYTYSKIPAHTIAVPQFKGGNSQSFNYRLTIPSQWWQLYHSTSLNLLMERGLKNNPTLAAAKKSLAVAENILRAQIGNLMLPGIDLTLAAQRTQASGIAFASDTPATIFSVYNIQSQVSYTFDLFGKNRRMIEYYRAAVAFQRYELLAAYLTLTANITTTAITIASLEAQLKATDELIAIEKKVLAIQKSRLKIGGVSREDVSLQATLLAQTVAMLPPIKKALAEQNNALAALSGSLTSDSPALHLNLDSLHLAKQLPVSLPSKLVRQRPDILAAEAMMHEMSAEVGVATANLLPQITLTGYFGWLADLPEHLFIPASKVWSIGGNLLQPLFHAGSLIYQRKAAVAKLDQYYDKYKAVVLKAFREVANALHAINYDASAFKANADAEISSYKTAKIALQRYKLGGENYLNVLTAQQKYLQNKLNRIKAQAQRYTDTAGLFQALGGGWWSAPALPRPDATQVRRLHP